MNSAQIFGRFGWRLEGCCSHSGAAHSQCSVEVSRKRKKGTFFICEQLLNTSTVQHLSMADEEPVDQKKYLEDRCKPKCAKPLFEYQACVRRIQDDESGHKHCTGQYFDYWSCVDKCVAPKLVEKLK